MKKWEIVAMTKKKFTVYYMPEGDYEREQSPLITFGGNWLRDFGIDVGDKLELIQGRNMLVLMKVQKMVKGGWRHGLSNFSGTKQRVCDESTVSIHNLYSIVVFISAYPSPKRSAVPTALGFARFND